MRVVGSRLRNIGIIAHIDAGKTTTTENMLMRAKVTSFAGKVDDGNTVMDFMQQERERGITIQAAATAFQWKNARINLIDTPGHVDFTVEVERAVRVIDGAALIVDAVAGAQAQTETVWRQARQHSLSAVAFVNKMDRDGANLEQAIDSVAKRLQLQPLQLQLPIFSCGEFSGVIDLVDRRALTWENSADSKSEWDLGPKTMRELPLNEISGLSLAEVDLAREALVEAVAELQVEGEIADAYIQGDEVAPTSLRKAIRKLCVAGCAVPTLCGASLHGVGVEPLLDAIVNYLPCPDEVKTPSLLPPSSRAVAGASATSDLNGKMSLAKVECASTSAMGNVADAIALAFKVVHEPQTRKPLVWLRVYSGDLKSGDELVLSSGAGERITQLLRLHGQSVQQVESVSVGDICAARGLRTARTGETLLLRPQNRDNPPQLAGVNIPPPVFFCAIETSSSTQHAALDEALSAISLEDPSVSVFVERTTGQQLLGGMGELHLEVLTQRLRSEWKLDVLVGSPQVAYKESLCGHTSGQGLLHVSRHDSRLASGGEIEVELELTSLLPEIGNPAWTQSASGEPELDISDEVCSGLTRRQVTSISNGMSGAMQYGPLLGSPLASIRAIVRRLVSPKGVSTEAMAVAVSEALSTAMEKSTPVLLEPRMRVEVDVPEEYIGTVLTEISGARRGAINSLTDRDGRRHLVDAMVPLASLVGYASALRSLTKGSASLSMEFDHYAQLGNGEQSQVLLSKRGFV